MIVVDTSVLSLAFRRKAVPSPTPAVTLLAEAIRADRQIGVPGVVLQELLSGVRNVSEFTRLNAVLGGFSLLIATRATHVRAAQLANRCHAAGIAAATTDTLIAAHAIEVGAPLLTLDEDFTRFAKISELQLARVTPAR